MSHAEGVNMKTTGHPATKSGRWPEIEGVPNGELGGLARPVRKGAVCDRTPSGSPERPLSRMAEDVMAYLREVRRHSTVHRDVCCSIHLEANGLTCVVERVERYRTPSGTDVAKHQKPPSSTVSSPTPVAEVLLGPIRDGDTETGMQSRGLFKGKAGRPQEGSYPEFEDVYRLPAKTGLATPDALRRYDSSALCPPLVSTTSAAPRTCPSASRITLLLEECRGWSPGTTHPTIRVLNRGTREAIPGREGSDCRAGRRGAGHGYQAAGGQGRSPGHGSLGGDGCSPCLQSALRSFQAPISGDPKTGWFFIIFRARGRHFISTDDRVERPQIRIVLNESARI